MRLFRLAPLALAAAASSAFAADAFDISVANFAILQDKRVQKEVGLTQAQRDRLNGFAAADAKRRGAIISGAQKAKEKQLTPAQRKGINDSLLKLRSDVLNSLQPRQLKRLRELTIQSAGPVALLDATIAKRLNVTLDQRKKIAAIYQAGQKQALAIRNKALGPIAAKYKDRKPKNQAEAQKLQASFNGEIGAAAKRIGPDLARISADTGRKMMMAATPQQRSAFEALKGKAYRPS